MVTRGITKGVKEAFRLAMECQVSRCEEKLMLVLYRFCVNEKILLLQTLASPALPPEAAHSRGALGRHKARLSVASSLFKRRRPSVF
ncbi:hypothetical protein EI555_002531 [Monodon monoceros]|uniref:Integrator complex subunit 10 n=1 Tax=Monodon monoceros TaxID=40151 RepID=A0A4U1F401_MONMO|nr:hypothetical protein EI555_002531 [Monodon monoceros]